MDYNLPLVSIIIPTFNRSEYLKSAIRSVLNQTYKNFELIVVDDYSTDNTADVVNSFNDRRIIYLKNEKNRGASASRNNGIKKSNGKYIALLDDDDEWLPEKLNILVKKIQNSPENVGVVYSGYIRINSSRGEIVRTVFPKCRGGIYEKSIVSNRLGTASVALIKRECFDIVGLFDESMPSRQDSDMFIRIAEYYHFDYVAEPLVIYKAHIDKISTNIDAQVKGEEIFLKKYGELYEKLDGIRCSYTYFVLGSYYLRLRKTDKGRRAYLKAIKLNPYVFRYYINLFISLFGSNVYCILLKIKNYIFSPKGNI